MRLDWVAISNGKGGAGAHDPTPTSVPIIYVRPPELNQVFTVVGAILAAENCEGMNSKRGRREEECSEGVLITCHGHKTLPSHAAKILRQLLTFVKSNRQPAHRIDCPLESDYCPDQDLETDGRRTGAIWSFSIIVCLSCHFVSS